MGFRFFRRIRIAPGLTVNLSKSGASLSIGPRGAKYTIGPRGSRTTVGLPGTGLFYTTHHGKPPAGAPRRPAPPPPPKQPVRAADRPFVDGIRALGEGRHDDALAAFERIADRPDAAWLAGLLRLRGGDSGAARRHLSRALEGRANLGALIAEYGVSVQIDLPVAPEVTAHIQPEERGTRLALVEAAQHEGDHGGAMAQLEQLLALEPADPVVQLSFAELAMDPEGGHAGDRALMQRVVAMTGGTANETAIDSALLLYRARALAALGLRDGAIEVLGLALRRRKDRAPALLHQIRHDRAALYDEAGRSAEARREFERLFAEAPDFPGLRERLGLGG